MWLCFMFWHLAGSAIGICSAKFLFAEDPPKILSPCPPPIGGKTSPIPEILEKDMVSESLGRGGPGNRDL